MWYTHIDWSQWTQKLSIWLLSLSLSLSPSLSLPLSLPLPLPLSLSLFCLPASGTGVCVCVIKVLSLVCVCMHTHLCMYHYCMNVHVLWVTVCILVCECNTVQWQWVYTCRWGPQSKQRQKGPYCVRENECPVIFTQCQWADGTRFTQDIINGKNLKERYSTPQHGPRQIIASQGSIICSLWDSIYTCTYIHVECDSGVTVNGW